MTNMEKVLKFANDNKLVKRIVNDEDGFDGGIFLPGTTVFRDENKVSRVFVSSFFGDLVEFADGTSIDVTSEGNFNRAISKIKAIVANGEVNNTPLTFKEKHPGAMFDGVGLPISDSMVDIVNMIGRKFEVFFEVPDLAEGWAVIEVRDDNNIEVIEIIDDIIKLNDETISVEDLINLFSKIFKVRD